MQQCLPFTVLKRSLLAVGLMTCDALQQCLPFTVLKLSGRRPHYLNKSKVATAPTVYGIETLIFFETPSFEKDVVATAPTIYSIETRKS